MDALPVAYDVGDVIEFLTLKAQRCQARVLVRHEHIRGAPGFEGEMRGADIPVWGYDQQVLRVLTPST